MDVGKPGMCSVVTDGRVGGNQPAVHLLLVRDEVVRMWDLLYEYECESTIREETDGFHGFYDFGRVRHVVEFDGGGKVVLSGVVHIKVKAVPKGRVGIIVSWAAVLGRNSRGDNGAEDSGREHRGVPSGSAPSS